MDNTHHNTHENNLSAGEWEPQATEETALLNGPRSPSLASISTTWPDSPTLLNSPTKSPITYQTTTTSSPSLTSSIPPSYHTNTNPATRNSLIPTPLLPLSKPPTQRIPRLQPRGILHFHPSSSTSWLNIIQSFISYTFRDADLLEEALESPGSGVSCVGKSRRCFTDGNIGMAGIGEEVLRLVVREQCYLYRIDDAKSSTLLTQTLSRQTLSAQKYSPIASCIRPKPLLAPTTSFRSWKNIKQTLKDDLREDVTRTIARAVKAVLGAVYLDGGVEAAKMVVGNLELGVRLPPRAEERFRDLQEGKGDL